MASLTNSGVALAVTSSSATTGRIDLDRSDGGGYTVPTGSSLTTITWHVSRNGTTIVPLFTNGVAVVQTVAAAQAHEIPIGCNVWRWLHPVGNAAGTIYFTTKQMGAVHGQVGA